MDVEEKYMYRCLQLAQMGAGSVAPNPMVGAVLLHQGRIIGEGYHKKFGEAHAEINCLASVKKEDRQFIADSIMYVSLEPCAHYGKTPPCVDAIIKHKIKHVVVASKDSFDAVNGRGIQILKDAGIAVTENILQQQAIFLNRRFFTYHSQKRPYIILKWAQSANGFIAGQNNKQVKISNEITNKLVHKWRSEEDAILVGTNTVFADNPQLTNRLWTGKNPVRVIVDLELKLPADANVFDGSCQTIVINFLKEDKQSNLLYHRMEKNENIIPDLLKVLHHYGLTSVIVEGGAKMLQSFIHSGLWDEARVITNKSLQIHSGLPEPVLKHSILVDEQILLHDHIQYFQNPSQHLQIGVL